MPIVSRALVTIQAETDEEIDKVWRDLAAKRDENTDLYVSITETGREVER